MSFGAAHAAGQLTNEILSRMDGYNARLSALTAKIKMDKVNNQLGGITETEFGELRYVPDKQNKKERKPLVLINFKKPERHFLIRDGQYFIYQPGTNQAYTGRTSSVKGQTNEAGPLSFLSMSREDLKRNFKHEFLGEATVQSSKKDRTIHLRLRPTGSAKYKYAEIWVTKDGLPIQTMIVDGNGDSTTILLTEHDDRAKIDRGIFTINIPKGANVHKEG
jgi:outer membrane lipoprotein-sorting protein